MTDRRFHRANPRIAHSTLAGKVAVPVTEGRPVRVALPVADLRRAPGGSRDKQMLMGQPFQVLEDHDGWVFGFDPVDGYVGYLRSRAVADLPAPTHRVRARMAHVYAEPDIKAAETALLSFFSGVVVKEEAGDFLGLQGGGFVARPQLAPVSWRAGDPAGIAELFLGTPYLWGGNTGWGVDCSGLVQLAFHAAGRVCARDSDVQARAGTPVATRADLRRGDLVFWRGHVGMMLDHARLIHANAHHMCVAVEPLDAAIARIGTREFGQVTGFRRM